MTTYETREIDFDAVSEPISGETRATVELVGNDWLADNDWQRFESACRFEAKWTDGEVDPAGVRKHFLDRYDELTINPRRLSAFYNRAASKSGFLDFSHWGINTDTKGRNAGRPARIYKLRASP